MTREEIEYLNSSLRNRWPRIISNIRAALLPERQKITQILDGYNIFQRGDLPYTYSAALTRYWMRRYKLIDEK